MSEKIEKIISKLEEHEVRLRALEGGVHPFVAGEKHASAKQKTLREIVRGKSFKNGSEKLAIIVGYYERILGTRIKRDDLGKEWEEAKMPGVYKTNLLDDALNIYIRIRPGEECDLTQSGEDFFEIFLKNESSKTTA